MALASFWKVDPVREQVDLLQFLGASRVFLALICLALLEFLKVNALVEKVLLGFAVLRVRATSGHPFALRSVLGK